MRQNAMSILKHKRLLSSSSSSKSVLVDIHDGFASVILNRPEVHNAFSDHVITELDAIFTSLRNNKDLRGVFLKSTGKSFCAGADLDWMRRASTYTREQNLQDALNLSSMLNNLNTLPHPTICLVQGATYGGGVGLVSACDIAIGTQKAIFSLSEVKLGLIPATISPYVINAIGQRSARRYFLTAERFDAKKAQEIGLLHEVAENEAALEAKGLELKTSLLSAGPGAVRASKRLIESVANQPVTSELLTSNASRLADIRSTAEAKEGLAAFFERRAPVWLK